MGRVQVGPSPWKTALINIQLSGRLVFFKTISKQESIADESLWADFRHTLQKVELLIIRAFSADPGIGMAGVLALAFVFDELDAKTLLRVGKMRHRTDRHLELPTTVGTGANSGHRSDPLNHRKIAIGRG
jgi:hypothetical protein